MLLECQSIGLNVFCIRFKPLQSWSYILSFCPLNRFNLPFRFLEFTVFSDCIRNVWMCLYEKKGNKGYTMLVARSFDYERPACDKIQSTWICWTFCSALENRFELWVNTFTNRDSAILFFSFFFFNVLECSLSSNTCRNE